MLKLTPATQGVIFASIIYNKSQSLNEIKKIWSEHFDLYEAYTPNFNPSLEYYSKEMGEHLERVIFFSSLKVERTQMIDFKVWATSIESKYAENNKRSLNIDIGILCLEQVLLSTSKPYSHRIYLNKGVYAELTYKYENKSYHFLPWTYPDYQHQEKVDFFNSMRSRLF